MLFDFTAKGALTHALPFSSLLIAALTFLSVGEVHAQTTRYVSPEGSDDESGCVDVENPCRSIAGALIVAAPGDVISLSAGVFFESDVTIDKDVTIVGQGADVSIVDGDGAEGTRTYFVTAAEEARVEARQFSELTAGKSGASRSAYAESVRSSIASIQSASYSTSGSGQGAYVFRVSENARVEMEGITIRDGGGFWTNVTRGGIVNDGTLLVRNARLEHNVAFFADMDEDDSAGRGGAISNSGDLTVEGSVIRRNFAVGFALAGGEGGGIFNEGTLAVRSSTIEQNEAWDAQDFCKGGGVANTGEATVETSIIIDNHSDCFEGGAGGGIYNKGSLELNQSSIVANTATSVWEYTAGYGGGVASYGELSVVNSTIAGNESGSGGGVYTAGGSEIVSATIVENQAVNRPYGPGAGGGVSSDAEELVLWNTILAGNSTGDDLSAASADCSISGQVSSGFLVTGEETGCSAAAITVPPTSAVSALFTDVDSEDRLVYAPDAASPVIDSGDCSFGDATLALDQIGNPRPIDSPATSNTSDGCDVGAVESQNATEGKSEPTAALNAGGLPFELSLEQNYPNPVRTSTRLEFTIPATSHARLAVYDLMGREVGRVIDQTLKPGRHEVEWDAKDLPSGTYLYRLTAGSARVVRTLTLVR